MESEEADVKENTAYRHSHEAQVMAWWQEQHRANAEARADRVDLRTDMDALRTNLIVLQKRWMMLAGFAAALGGGVSNALGRMFP